MTTLFEKLFLRKTLCSLLTRWKSLERLWTMQKQPCHSLSVEMPWNRAPWSPNLLTPCIQRQLSSSGKHCIFLQEGGAGGGGKNIYKYCKHRKDPTLWVKTVSRPAIATSSRWLEGIWRWYCNAVGFSTLGWLWGDAVYENDDVREAPRRLPESFCNDGGTY